MFGAFLLLSAGLVYVSFVRKPANHPGEFLRKGRDQGTETVVVNAGASITHASLSADYVETLRRRHTGDGYEFVNAGSNGDTSRDLLERLDEIVACRPDAVTILVGTNDARDDSTTPQELRATMDAILARIQDETDARIAVLSLPPQGEDLTSARNRRVTRFNRALEGSARANGASYLPLYEALSEAIRAANGTDPPPFEFGIRQLLTTAFAHHLLRQSLNQIADRRGLVVLSDHIHLNDRGGAAAAGLIENWLDANT